MNLRLLTILSLSTLSLFTVQSCKTDSGSSDGGSSQASATPTPSVTMLPGTTETPIPSIASVPTAQQTAALTACVAAWQKYGIAPPPQTSNFTNIRVIDGNGQTAVSDPSPAATGAAASLVFVQMGAASTSAQLYGTNTWYCIDSSLVPNTVALSASVCTSGHGASGTTTGGAKSLKFAKDKSC